MSDRMACINQDRTSFFRISLVLLAVTLVAFSCGWLTMVGCTAPRHEARTINENPERYVRLQALNGRDQDEATMRFAHPMVLSEREWERVLDGLSVRPRKKFLAIRATQVEPSLAFDDNDRRYLAKHLAEAFVKAKPDETVVFYLSRNREPHVTEITSGGFFVEDGRLHVVMANYLQPVSMTFIQQQIRNDPLHSVGDAFYDFVPQHHQTLQTERGWGLTKYLLNQVPELVIDYRASLSVPDETQAVNASGKSEGEIGRGEGMPVEEALRKLKRLREQGIISDEEYQLRLKDLVDAL